jgi:glutaredoxin-like protein NrdH
MIYVYTQPGCRPCKQVAAKLLGAGVEHTVVDLSKNLLAADYVKRSLQAKSTPVVEDDDSQEVIIGYQPDRLKKLIERVTS